MKKVLLLSLLTISLQLFAQRGILPFSGLTYVYNGLSGKTIEVELDGDTWTSNRLPINKEFEIKLVEPQGLTLTDGKYYPGVELAFLKVNGDTLGYVPDLFGGESFEGFDEFTLKKLDITLGFNEQSKVGDTVIVRGRFFDSKGTGELPISMTLYIVDPSLPLENTNSTYGVNSYEGYHGMATGLDISDIHQSFDSIPEIEEYTLHLSVDPIKGMTKQEWMQGKTTMIAYTKGFLAYPMEVPEYELQVEDLELEGAEKGVSAAISLAMDKNGEYNTLRFVRLRWENKDHSKVVDVVSEIPW